ncbi:hypothetical protein [Chryseobacterium sp.]|uniref:hypothetical protein n=1 Tax=Chryseobacterium sp. TaxID=1871047 RepID=UPI0035B484E9
MSNLLQIEQFDAKQLPELQGMKEKQLQIVKENPFVEITDNKSYEEAKKARTTLVTARTEIQNQDKLIASKIKKFREAVAGVSEELIAITKPHEDKQQSEVKRWEEIKEQEKQEKIRLEEERKSKIRSFINSIIDEALEKINKLSFDMIGSLKVDFEENLYKTDVEQFEEFELDFNEKLIQVKNAFSSKIKTLEEAESQRLENIRLQEEKTKLDAEKAKIEADRKAEEERAKKEREALAAEKAKHEEELKAKDEEARKHREAEEAKLRKEREDIEAEKARLAKIESDRIAKEEAERKEKEDAERAEKEKAEAEAKAKAESERLEALKPEKQKAVEYIQSMNYSNLEPKITDELLKVEFERCLERISDAISDSISVIKNFK